MQDLAEPRLTFFANQSEAWWLEQDPFLRRHKGANLGLSAACSSHLPSSYAAHNYQADEQKCSLQRDCGCAPGAGADPTQTVEAASCSKARAESGMAGQRGRRA